MRVRMTTNITGFRDGEPWPAVGDDLDVGDAEGEQLIVNGYAELVDGSPMFAVADLTEITATDEPPAAPKRTRKAPARKA